MGAGASSSVKSIRINSSHQKEKLSSNVEPELETSSKNRSGKLHASQSSFGESDNNKNDTATAGNHRQESDVAHLKHQLANVESEKLDLLDRIHLLESQIEYLNTQHALQRQTSNCEETLHAKDQYISKLEQEGVSAEDNIAKLKIKHKRKVKFLSTQIAEIKQETSIRLLELRDEISRLTEENLRLNEKLRICETPRLDGKSDFATSLDDGRSKLVLELSQQMNEQNDRIEELQRSLHERDETIKKLQQCQIKQNTQKSPTESEAVQSSDMTELKSILHEMKSAQRQSKQHKNKARRSNSEIKDSYRGSSGKSCDSGLGSPGEPQSQSKVRNQRPGSSTSTLSGLSVTEDPDISVKTRSDYGKATSAPPTLVTGKPPQSRAPHPPNTVYSRDTEQFPDHGAKLLTSKRKKNFALKHRIKENCVEEKPCSNLNSFVDSDCDVESEILLDSFRRDPLFTLDTGQVTQSAPLGSILS